MAIKIDLQESQYGVPFAGAYLRIVSALVARKRSDEEKFFVMIDIVGYATAKPDDDTRAVDSRRLHVPLSIIEQQEGADFLAKCYSWVLTLPEMAGAVST